MQEQIPKKIKNDGWNSCTDGSVGLEGAQSQFLSDKEGRVRGQLRVG